MDTKKPVGNGINAPVLDNTKAKMQTITVDMNTQNGLETTASNVNLSAKFKNPQKKQEHVPAEAFNQYM